MFSLKLNFFITLLELNFDTVIALKNGLRDLLNKSKFSIWYIVLCDKSHLTVSSWTVACWAPLSVEFPWWEFLSGFPFPFPGGLPNPGIEPVSPAWQADSLPLSHLGSPLNRIVTTVLQRECNYPLNKIQKWAQTSWLTFPKVMISLLIH